MTTDYYGKKEHATTLAETAEQGTKWDDKLQELNKSQELNGVERKPAA